jgi:hypothetical protein
MWDYKVARWGYVSPLDVTALANTVFDRFFRHNWLLVVSAYMGYTVFYLMGNTQNEAVISRLFMVTAGAEDLLV